MTKLADLTTEQMAVMHEKSKAAKAAKYAARQVSTLRRDFMDAQAWEALARERGIRLPPWGAPCTISAMRTFLHKCGLSQAQYEAHYGKLQEFIDKNPTWPLRAWAGLVLEMRG